MNFPISNSSFWWTSRTRFSRNSNLQELTLRVVYFRHYPIDNFILKRCNRGQWSQVCSLATKGMDFVLCFGEACKELRFRWLTLVDWVQEGFILAERNIPPNNSMLFNHRDTDDWQIINESVAWLTPSPCLAGGSHMDGYILVCLCQMERLLQNLIHLPHCKWWQFIVAFKHIRYVVLF